MQNEDVQEDAGFGALGVPPLLGRALGRMGIGSPTQAQRAAIPAARTGRDVAVVAATGTGKTLAYVLPLAARLLEEPPPRPRGRPVDPKRRLRALVLCPTRELAQQVAREASELLRGTVLRATAVYGKSALAPQRDAVAAGVDLLVGTPGRVRELCGLDAVSLAFVKQVVLDEADRMLDMGFLPQAKEILSRAPESRQLLMFTATMPRPVEAVVEEMLRDPARIDLVGKERARVEGTPAERKDLGQRLYDVDDESKTAVTVALVKDGKRRGVVVFCRTRRRAGWVAAALRRHEVRTAVLHGDRSQRQREEALDAFAAGRADVLVATDVAARGLHVPAARCVVNYDVPILPEEYVHRVGRAGHGGGTAESFTFRCPADRERWMHVERAMRVRIEPEAPPPHGAYMRRHDAVAPDRERARPGQAGRHAPRRPRQEGEREAATTGKSLAAMIRNAPAAVRRKRKRLTAKAKPVVALRGKQRKSPIPKGQRPGGGVTRRA
ncbi:MAG: DEAD/DEAH box helicase [Phycisphaerales bacterium]